MAKGINENREVPTCVRCRREHRPTNGDFTTSTDTKCRQTPGKSSRSTVLLRAGLLCILFVCLLLLSEVNPAESRRLSKRGRNKSHHEDGTAAGTPTDGGGRRKSKRGKILNTSEKARIITQSKYLVSDWCKSKPLKQIVRSGNGCKGVFINHFCYGQCNSFYIPRDLTPDMTEPAYFKSCSFCKPHREEKISVTLTCSRSRGKRNRVIKRMVNKIKDCRCIAVPDVESQSAIPASPASSAAADPSTLSSVGTMASHDLTETRR